MNSLVEAYLRVASKSDSVQLQDKQRILILLSCIHSFYTMYTFSIAHYGAIVKRYLQRIRNAPRAAWWIISVNPAVIHHSDFSNDWIIFLSSNSSNYLRT